MTEASKIVSDNKDYYRKHKTLAVYVQLNRPMIDHPCDVADLLRIVADDVERRGCSPDRVFERPGGGEIDGLASIACDRYVPLNEILGAYYGPRREEARRQEREAAEKALAESKSRTKKPFVFDYRANKNIGESFVVAQGSTDAVLGRRVLLAVPVSGPGVAAKISEELSSVPWLCKICQVGRTAEGFPDVELAAGDTMSIEPDLDKIDMQRFRRIADPGSELCGLLVGKEGR